MVRDVARALLLDEDGRILLVHWRDPITGHEFLEPPGGVLEAGESCEDGLRREIGEETGIGDVQVGRQVAEIDHAFTFAGKLYDCRERYFVCRARTTQPRATRLDPVEEKGVVAIEWWDIDDLAVRPPDSLEPPQLLEMLRNLNRLSTS